MIGWMESLITSSEHFLSTTECHSHHRINDRIIAKQAVLLIMHRKGTIVVKLKNAD